jgi:hypothetical protein
MCDSEGLENLAGFLLLLILNAADINNKFLQITEHQCGLGTGGGWSDEPGW